MKVWGFEVRPINADRAVAALLLKTGLMGRSEQRVFRESIRPGQVVIDVGANQGVYTLLASRLVGDHGRVVALEPEPSLFEVLEENCRTNGAENVTCIRKAAGSGVGVGLLHCSRFNSGDNRLLTASVDGRAVEVAIAPLDELVSEPVVSFVKIDVQGFELEVLRGMEAILARNRGIRLFFEYWPAGLCAAGSAPREILGFLADRGFSLFEASRAGVTRREPKEIERSTGNGYWAGRNFLAVRE